MKKTRLFIKISLLSLFIVSLAACSKHPGYKKTDAGLYYKMIVKNETAPKPELGDVITIGMVYKTSTDSVLFNSYTDPRTMGQPLRLPLEKPIYKGDFSEGIAMMHIGDSASFITSADSFFFKYAQIPQLPPFIKAGSDLTFTIKLISIMKKADFEKQQQEMMAQQMKMIEKFKIEEPEKIKKYLDSNKIKVKPTASGLYYMETKKGTGANPVKGDTVAVHYTGTLVDGTTFDSSIGRPEGPLKFPIGVGYVIPGWEEGIGLMKKGGKAKLLIPSSLGYADKGAGQVIPPYTPLVFEVELVDIIKPVVK